MQHLYSLIQDGVVSLHQMPTHKLRQIAQETTDQRVRDLVGHIIMYERSYVQGRERRYA
jgi:hypothetical protein